LVYLFHFWTISLRALIFLPAKDGDIVVFLSEAIEKVLVDAAAFVVELFLDPKLPVFDLSNNATNPEEFAFVVDCDDKCAVFRED